MELSASPPRHSRVFAHRRRLAVLVLSLAFLTTAGYWLASSGVTGPTIQVLPGTSANGEVADITPMSSSVTETNGAAQLQVGAALAKMVVASSMSNHFRLQIAWTNASQAQQVLLNPNAQVSIGAYHPVYTGTCDSAANAYNGSHSVDAPYVNITDTDGTTKYCGVLDESATGSGSVSSTGKLLLARNLIAGFLKPGLDESSETTVVAPGAGGYTGACGGTADDTLTDWCQPASIQSGGTDTHQRLLYLVDSIVTPGGIPQGQQSSLTDLYFFEAASQVG